jgi:hypothetical protein
VSIFSTQAFAGKKSYVRLGDLYVIRRDGSGRVRLTSGDVDNPRWRAAQAAGDG